MAYDEALAERLRDELGDEVTEKKMFGGVGFLVAGNMAVGVSSGGELIVRADPADYEGFAQEPGARPFEIGGRGMKGWLLIDPTTLADHADLVRWIDRGTSYAGSLPPK
ncbi:MAG: hypothetical protein QOE64_2515 [Frankiales bacterium]|jgi:TfoX/Sxy family transcriptional regulator of competence genes|nr:hypothetical protein [Frankiales bacterium]